jgi:hypothetical protein
MSVSAYKFARCQNQHDRIGNSNGRDNLKNCVHVIKNKSCEWGLVSHPESLQKYLHIALTPVATVHIGKNVLCLKQL